jgi:hypothetical protein
MLTALSATAQPASLPVGYQSSLVTYGFPKAATNGAPNTVAEPL